MKIIKRIGTFLVCLCVLGQTVYAEEVQETSPLELHGFSAILMDADSGSVLYEEHYNLPYDPASLTKIMSVAVALDRMEIDQELTLSHEAFNSYDHNSGVLWIQEGETMSVRSASYASMLASANDTTAMLAEGSYGSLEKFVAAMNSQAQKWEMSDTMFDNPFGYASEGNYSTAYDIAKMVRQVWKEEPFSTIFGASSYTIPATNKKDSERLIAQDCELLRAGTRAYENTIGCKIGSTASGGYSIVAIAEQEHSRFIAVVLGCENVSLVYDDVMALFRYGFEHFHTVYISPEEIGIQTKEVYDGRHHIADIDFSIEKGYRVLLPSGVDESLIQTEIQYEQESTLDPEQIQAKLVFYIDGMESGEAMMKKEIHYQESARPKTLLETIRYDFDMMCVGVLGLFIFRRIYQVIHRLLAPHGA